MDQATPGDAGSRAENLRPGPTGSTRAGDSRAGMLAEPEGARARNAWGLLAGRARPAPAGGLNRSKGQYVSLCVAVCRPPDGPGPSAGPGRIPGRRFALSTRRDILAILEATEEAFLLSGKDTLNNSSREGAGIAAACRFCRSACSVRLLHILCSILLALYSTLAWFPLVRLISTRLDGLPRARYSNASCGDLLLLDLLVCLICLFV